MDCRDVAFKTVETVLGRDHFVPLGLKRRDQLAEARAIGPEPVSEYNAWFCFHKCFLRCCFVAPNLTCLTSSKVSVLERLEKDFVSLALMLQKHE